MKTFENTVVQFNNEQELRQIESYYNLVVIGSTNSGYVECWGDFDVLKGAHNSIKQITFHCWKEAVKVPKLNISQGKWTYKKASRFVVTDKTEICEVFDGMFPALDEGTLIADAGNTYNQCQTLPSELLRQRDELVDQIKRLLRVFEGDEHYEHGTIEAIRCAEAKELIKSITDNK